MIWREQALSLVTRMISIEMAQLVHPNYLDHKNTTALIRKASSVRHQAYSAIGIAVIVDGFRVE
jgi:hypothetical protein